MSVTFFVTTTYLIVITTTTTTYLIVSFTYFKLSPFHHHHRTHLHCYDTTIIITVTIRSFPYRNHHHRWCNNHHRRDNWHHCNIKTIIITDCFITVTIFLSLSSTMSRNLLLFFFFSISTSSIIFFTVYLQDKRLKPEGKRRKCYPFNYVKS